MLKDLNIYIHKLQSLDEDAKKIWLIVLTAITVTFVVLFWIVYLNYTVVAVNDRNTPEEPGVWEVFKAGFKTIGEKVEFGLASSYLYFTQGRQINISK